MKRNKAFCGSVRVPNKRAKLLASTLPAALALGWFGLFILFRGRSDLTCGQIFPPWTHETVRFHTSFADHDGLHAGSLMFRVGGSDDGSSNLRVPLCNHLDGICPTRPMRGMPQFDCAPQTESSHGQGELPCGEMTVRNAPTTRCTLHASIRSEHPAPPHALTERPHSNLPRVVGPARTQ